MTVDVISDSSIQVQWGPPSQANGILTHYTVTVFNRETGFDFSTQVNTSAAEVITVPGLRMLTIQPPTIKLMLTNIILVGFLFSAFYSLYCTSVGIDRGWRRHCSHFSHLHQTWR